MRRILRLAVVGSRVHGRFPRESERCGLHLRRIGGESVHGDERTGTDLPRSPDGAAGLPVHVLAQQPGHRVVRSELLLPLRERRVGAAAGQQPEQDVQGVQGGGSRRRA